MPVKQEPGPRLNIKTVFPRYGIPMLKIRRSQDRLILNTGILILVRRFLMLRRSPVDPFTNMDYPRYVIVRIRNHIPSTVWTEITYSFPNFNGCLGMDK